MVDPTEELWHAGLSHGHTFGNIGERRSTTLLLHFAMPSSTQQPHTSLNRLHLLTMLYITLHPYVSLYNPAHHSTDLNIILQCSTNFDIFLQCCTARYHLYITPTTLISLYTAIQHCILQSCAPLYKPYISLQSCATLYSLLHFSAILCNAPQIFTLLCNTVHYFTMLCDTPQPDLGCEKQVQPQAFH